MSYQYTYVMKGLSKTFPGGKEVLKNVWLSFFKGAKIGIIGPNGAGKSTLLKIMSGIDKDFQGEAWAANGVKIGYLQQEPTLDESLSVFDNIKSGLTHVYDLISQFEKISERFQEPLDDAEMTALIDEQAALQEKLDELDAWDFDRKVSIAMDALRCPDPNSSVKFLSGGEKRRVALCRLLMQHPDLLLLDEPTNHLDAQSIVWLERYLQNYSGTVVLITHDRYFLDKVVSWILEIDRGEGIPFEGNYSSWLEQKQKRLEIEQKHESSKQKQLAKELEWIRSSPKARQSKSKARIQAYEELLNEERNSGSTDGTIKIPSGPRLGDLVISVSNMSKAYGEKLLIDNASFSLRPGSIVGVIGPNGAGKSTLSKIICGLENPDFGDIKVGETVVMSYVDQSRDVLDPNKTVFEVISGGLDEIILGKKAMSSRAYCGLFNFKGSDQQKIVSQLSGGERNRVHLARILKSGANVLFLDEPTNDLDVETLRSLEEALMNFAGCAFVVSHDRWFLDRIATHILAFEGDSQLNWFEGNYEAYEEDLKRRFGDKAFEPTKIKFKPIVR